MFNLNKQLYIEGFLSKGRPYLASHPELGVPLGVFNTFDEPDHASRIKSIRKLGKEGNPLSLKLAKKMGIKNPIPSFPVDLVQYPSGDVIKVTDASFEKAIRKAGYTKDTGQSYSYKGTGDSAILSTINRSLEELSVTRSQADLTMGKALDMMQTMTFISGKSVKDNLGDIQAVYLDILSLTDVFRKDIISNLGVDEGMMEGVILGITDARREFEGYAITVNDAFETQMAVSEATGRLFILPKEALVEATKLQKLYKSAGLDMGEVIGQFEKIGKGSLEASETTSRAIATAGKYGAVVSKFLPTVTANIDKINTYGFQDGVDGLSRMVAEAQVLGYNFENVMQMADMAFSPEGAIEMAAKLQMIGGAASELLDPFQLMYMAQNDVEGLEKAIIKTAESAVTFNKETGEFGISPGERARLKAMAEATGQDYNNLAETAIRAAKRTQAIGKLGGIPELNEQDKKLIASMADIDASGEFMVKLGTEEIGFDQLGDMIDKDSTIMERLRKQSEKDSMDLDSVNKAQLSVQEGMAANVAIIQNYLTDMAASGMLGTSAQDFAHALATSGLGNELVQGQIELFEGGQGLETPSLNDMINTTTDLFGKAIEKTASGTGIGRAWGDATTDTNRNEPIDMSGFPTGGAFGGTFNPNDITAFLENTPEGQDILNNYNNTNTINNNTVGNPDEVKVVFSPLEIRYDGNTIKLTPNQVREVLPPLFDEIAMGVSKSNTKSTTPNG